MKKCNFCFYSFISTVTVRVCDCMHYFSHFKQNVEGSNVTRSVIAELFVLDILFC